MTAPSITVSLGSASGAHEIEAKRTVNSGNPMTISKLVKKPIAFRALIAFFATTLTAAWIVHSISADVYYNLNLISLQTTAELAVRAGAEYLPADSRAAAQVAAAYAENNGVAFNEIILVRVDSNKQTLRIRLNRKIPIYMALFAVGLPRPEIAVTASAHRRIDRPEAPPIALRHAGFSGLTPNEPLEALVETFADLCESSVAAKRRPSQYHRSALLNCYSIYFSGSQFKRSRKVFLLMSSILSMCT